MSTKRAVNWPGAIRVRGLPFMLQGWNNIYTREDVEGRDYPTYVLKSYTLYGCIDIFSAYIGWNSSEGCWQLRRGDELIICRSKHVKPLSGDACTQLLLLLGQWKSGDVEPITISTDCIERGMTINPPSSRDSVILLLVFLVVLMSILYVRK